MVATGASATAAAKVRKAPDTAAAAEGAAVEERHLLGAREEKHEAEGGDGGMRERPADGVGEGTGGRPERREAVQEARAALARASTAVAAAREWLDGGGQRGTTDTAAGGGAGLAGDGGVCRTAASKKSKVKSSSGSGIPDAGASWAAVKAMMCCVLHRMARKQARRRGGAKGNVGAGSSAQHSGHKRAHFAASAPTASIQHSGDLSANQEKRRKNNEYERQYPGRTQEQEKRGEGPDRPKRKRVDGSVCYANSGEGSKRRCDATGRPPGRPPGG